MGKIELGSEQSSLLATLSPGKRTRLRRLLYDYGPGEGTLLFLPIDQGIEHGPRDFFPNPASKDPEYQFRLAAEAGYSAIACGYGMASKYYPDYAGQVPLLLKLNSKTDVPPADEAFSPCNAIGRGRACGSAPTRSATRSTSARRKQEEDFVQLGKVRADCDRFGMPLVIWAYPRGRDIEKKGGQRLVLRDRLRRARGDGDGRRRREAEHAQAQPRQGQGRARALQRDGGHAGGGDPPLRGVRGQALVVLSGGSKVDDDKLLEQTRMIMEAGGSGVIFGRNVWQREWNRRRIIDRSRRPAQVAHAHPVACQVPPLSGAAALVRAAGRAGAGPASQRDIVNAASSRGRVTVT